MNEFIALALYGILIPLPIAAIFALIARRLAARERPRLAGLFFTLAVALPMPIAFLLVNGAPEESWEALLWLAPAAAAIGLAFHASPILKRELFPALSLAAVLTLLLWPILKAEDSWLVRLAPASAAAALYLALRFLASRVPQQPLLLCVWAAALAAGLAVVIMGQRPMAAAVAPVGASILVLAILARRSDRHALTPGPLAAAAAPIAITPAVAWMWMSVTGANYGLWLPLAIPFSATAAALLLVPPIRRLRPPVRGAIAVAAVLFLGLGLVAAAFALDARSSNDDDYGDLPDFMRFPTN